MPLAIRSRLVDTSALSRDPAVIFVLDQELRITSCNDAWDVFAQENGGGKELLAANQAGKLIFDCVPEALQDFYRSLYESVRRSGIPGEHFYDCSSPTLDRKLHMRLLPLQDFGEIAVVNSLLIEAPHPAGVPQPSTDYVQSNGIVTMCANCRRTHRAQTEHWDLVPNFIERMPDHVSHGLCPVCFAYHYPDLA